METVSKDKDVEDVLPFGNFGLVSDTKSVWVNCEHQALSSTGHHDAKRRGNIKSADTCMLVIIPHLVTIFPDGKEIECVKEFDVTSERGH